MSGRQWRMTGEEFHQAVRSFERDRLPYPIRVLPLGHGDTPPTAEEYERVRAAAARRLRELADKDLFDAVHILLEPQVRVEVHGRYDRDLARVVRMHAGAAGRSATLAIQLPGPTKEYGGDIELFTCDSRELAGQVIANLPQCAPGRYATVRGTRAEIGEIEFARHPTHISRIEVINRVMRLPRSGIGEIGVFAGPAVDSRPTGNPNGFHWMDHLPHDGRYLLHKHGAEDFTLTPATPAELTRHLRHALTAAATRSPDTAAPPAPPRTAAPRRETRQEDIDADDAYFRDRNQRGWLV